MTLSRESPFILRFLAWFNERFPAANAIFILLLYAAALVLGRFLTGAGAVPLRAADALGFLALYSFFLMLRVFDEHKDYELDCQNHPQRVLQSGLITLTHLKIAGGFAIAAQLVISLWRDGWTFGPVTRIWTIVIAWSLLMAKEFFAHAWLSRRLVLYAVSHMIVLPMAMVWIAQLAAGGVALPASIALLAGAAFCTGFAVELARKTRAPEQERETVDSYTKVFGTRGAPLVVLGVLLAQAIALALLLHLIDAGTIWYVGAIALVLAPAAFLLRFRAQPTPKAAKQIEAGVALGSVLAYGVLIAAILLQRGVAL